MARAPPWTRHRDEEPGQYEGTGEEQGRAVVQLRRRVRPYCHPYCQAVDTAR